MCKLIHSLYISCIRQNTKIIAYYSKSAAIREHSGGVDLAAIKLVLFAQITSQVLTSWTLKRNEPLHIIVQMPFRSIPAKIQEFRDKKF